LSTLVALHSEGSSVFDVALHPSHPSPPLAVSGGEDDLAFLFDTNTGKEILKLTGHTDSVVAVSFSTLFYSPSRSGPTKKHADPACFGCRCRWRADSYWRDGRSCEDLEEERQGVMGQVGVLDEFGGTG
jgi:hypothetical protein